MVHICSPLTTKVWRYWKLLCWIYPQKMPVSIEGLPREFPTKKRTAYKYIYTDIYNYTVNMIILLVTITVVVRAPFLRIPKGFLFFFQQKPSNSLKGLGNHLKIHKVHRHSPWESAIVFLRERKEDAQSIWAILAYTLHPKYLYNYYVAQKKPVHTVGGRNPANHRDAKNPVVNHWINYLWPGAGFLPSTVWYQNQKKTIISSCGTCDRARNLLDYEKWTVIRCVDDHPYTLED